MERRKLPICEYGKRREGIAMRRLHRFNGRNGARKRSNIEGKVERLLETWGRGP